MSSCGYVILTDPRLFEGRAKRGWPIDVVLSPDERKLGTGRKCSDIREIEQGLVGSTKCHGAAR